MWEGWNKGSLEWWKVGMREGWNEGRLNWKIGIRGKWNVECGNIKIKCLSLSKSYPSTPLNLCLLKMR